jgi:hypothetical protein
VDRDPLTLIADLAAELCDGRQHIERIPFWDANRNRKVREWRTVQPGLLTQLHRAAVEPVRGQTEPGSRPLPGSRPPLALEALSTYRVITTATIRWCWSLRLDLRDSVEGNIRSLVGAAATLDPDTALLLLAEMRQWRRWAAVATGWQTPAFAPRAPCPNCATIGKLRINLSAQAAHCRACQATWAGDDGSLYELAGYIRAVTERVPA